MIFERNVNRIGTGLGIILSNDIIKYLELEYNTPIVLEVDENKDGVKYIRITRASTVTDNLSKL